ncbi:MDR/zinc-dependent alcohol dehydrogenase-like family protein [Phycisphaera mikurensis]|uniref:FAD/NAD(P)-binding domain-containing protein n=1 Tax=Phycisphaera mikurensis (strain NBRC 102666 / KCTC 22515 / FYK2301M01) TaxID=1142394 RepID=I0IC69_PHYMF|nr:hypothetical protein [Phycisphaera mikurensis]MBB6441924.1 siroheme synthase (precorrin-2 oxidase/ferrochelatase) [Phycisphaera mikurensis]BAM02857.1 hypothetical protein PSMK_06980 [Phycisphaera mikurensis NBRC 102666]
MLIEQARLAGGVYGLSGRFRPGSIRDVAWRAEQLAAALVEAGVLGPGTEVVIAGVGPAGVAATGACLAAGATVTVVSGASGRQSILQRSTRHVCPTTFDHPMDHWQIGSHPLPGQDAAVAWAAGPADRLLAGFAANLNRWLRETPRFRVVGSTDFVGYEAVGGGGVVVSCSGGLTLRADLLLLATGIGFSRRGVPGSLFRSRDYWESHDTVFKPPRAAGLRVLVAGGGDGALNDLVRLLTGRASVDTLLEEVDRCLPLTLVREHAEHAWREFAAGGDEAAERRRLRDRQRWLDGHLDELWGRAAVRAVIGDAALPLTRRSCVRLVTREAWFDDAYLVNRLLAGLLLRFLGEDLPGRNGGLVPLLCGWEVAGCVGLNGHACEGDRHLCAKHPHRVRFRRWPGAARPDADRPFLSTRGVEGDYDRVLLRIGADAAAGAGAGADAGVAAAPAGAAEHRHVPPFYSRGFRDG